MRDETSMKAVAGRKSHDLPLVSAVIQVRSCKARSETISHNVIVCQNRSYHLHDEELHSSARPPLVCSVRQFTKALNPTSNENLHALVLGLVGHDIVEYAFLESIRVRKMF